MRIGFSLPFRHKDGTAPTGREVAAVAKAIEAAGFDGIWIADAVARGGAILPDPLAWLGVAAASTEQVELGTAILQLPVRAPVELAQRVLTLHALSNGRFRFGVGTGSNERDYKAAGADFSRRFSTLSEYAAIIRALCRGEQVGEARLVPWSNTLGGPPMLVGSWVSPIWIRRAARDFDGWLTSGGGPSGNTFRNLKDGIKIYREAGGMRAMIATVQVDLTAESEPLSDETRLTLRCSPQEALHRVKAAEALGYDDLLLRKDDLVETDVLEVAALLGLKPRAPAGAPA